MTDKKSSTTKHKLTKRILWAVFYTVLVVAAFFGAQLLLVALVYVLKTIGVPLEAFNNTVLLFSLSAMTYALALVVVLLISSRIDKSSSVKKDLGIQRLLSWGDIFAGVLSFIPYVILSAVVITVASGIIPGFDIAQKQDVGFENLVSSMEMMLAFLALVVIAPLVEELLFRGYLYTKLKKYLGMAAGIILVSVVFGVMHGQLNVGVDTFVLSVVLCGLREITGSVWAGVVLHMAKNGLAFYLLFVNPSLISTMGM
ncbi:CPBP family intramembrane metalloprotease [Candidatus Nomurabacteria bacterium]|nr:CPBP family intramembrane metalloprotease [Candidatus Nomurabacteria bacterium]